METPSVVKDFILDFAQKIADARCQGNLNQSVEDIKQDFVSKMVAVRNKIPQYLYINYNQNISEEEAEEVFVNIKSNVSGNYRFVIPLPQYAPITIDGIKLEIPGISTFTYPNEDFKGLFVLYYDTNENKIASLNQTLLQILLTLPIKNILLNLVDLNTKYEDEFLLQNLPPQIYNEAPITSEEQLLRLLDRLEKRKLEVITKYDDFGKYCVQHKTFPIPYELVVLYDEVYDEAIRKRLNALIDDSARIGIYFILPRKATKVLLEISEPYVFSPNNKEIYTLDIPELIKNGSNAHYTGLYFVVFDADVDILSDSQNRPDDSEIVVGEGDYEVWIEGNLSMSSNFRDRNDYSGRIPHRYYNAPIGLFPTEQEAINFMNKFCRMYNMPLDLCLYPPSIRFDIEEHTNFFGTYYDIFLEIKNSILETHIEELRFYLMQLGLSKAQQERIFSILRGEQHADEYGKYGKEVWGEMWCSFYYWKSFNTNDEVYDFLYKQLFPQIDNKAEQMWGKNYKFNHLYLCSFSHYFLKGIPLEYVERDIDLGDLHLLVKKRSHISIPIEHFETPANDGLINFTPITNNPTLLKACFDYIRTEAEAKEEMKVQTLDFGLAAGSKYETDLSTMIIPVGKAESKDADFRMDLVSHVHSFIIGQSGSGKSVFLHNIIGGAMLKYAPEDLQLYLLDFKLGGVEFNRYQGAKHVKALLVDNSDPQVTLEILRELRGSMTERGKLLRGAGVNNIGEYNKQHQQDRMPHVLLVADECHEMFKADDSIPRQVRNEISDIVIKIAKEGRSQGVHLVFATQTLSGTEISSEIINNVSDFYLLKCAQTDSERLVPNSSAITSELTTGQIYYHHVDEQVKFQAYYTDKETAEKLMGAIVEKAKDHKSNGEFYFNGAQMFYLDEGVKEQIQNVKGKSPVAFLGKAIDISQKDLFVKLNKDFSENVLLLGLNDQEQVTRTTLNMFISLMMSAKLKHKDIAFKVIDCLNNEEGEVHEQIFDLENEGYCEIIERRQRSKFLKDLALGVLDGTAEETILLILGQDRFRELKMDMELEESKSSKSSDGDDMMSISDDFFGSGDSSSSNIRTYRDALNVILDKGPDYGVHTLLQIEKATNLLFEDYITPKVVFQKFKHLVMLRSDETTSVTLHLNDDIRLEKLSSDWERLRAYYYAEESDSYTLFTPYMPSDAKTIIHLMNTIS